MGKGPSHHALSYGVLSRVITINFFRPLGAPQPHLELLPKVIFLTMPGPSFSTEAAALALREMPGCTCG